MTVYGYALMKTLTELSGSLIRVAAAAVAEAKRSLPAEEKPVDPAPEVPAPAPAEPGAEGASPAADSAVAPEAPAGETAEASPPGEPAASDAVSAALDAAVAKATGLSGERLSMLRAAIEAVGRRPEDVRLVRVFGPEEQIPGAKAIGGHQYVVDFFPQSMKQVVGGPKDDRGGRRGGRGGRGGGGGGGGRGGGGGAKAGATGGFSMDSLREDRKGERGRFGGGRPGGGRPGGGRGGPGGGGRGGSGGGGGPKP